MNNCNVRSNSDIVSAMLYVSAKKRPALTDKWNRFINSLHAILQKGIASVKKVLSSKYCQSYAAVCSQRRREPAIDSEILNTSRPPRELQVKVCRNRLRNPLAEKSVYVLGYLFYWVNRKRIQVEKPYYIFLIYLMIMFSTNYIVIG